MNTTTHRISFAGRLGHWFGRGWRAYARGEQWASAWLVSQGVPAAGAAIALWVVKIGVLTASLYVAFWLALLLVLLFVAASVSWSEPEARAEFKGPEWRNGPAGYGLYTNDDWLIDQDD
jgi:hypothetical protein